MTTIWEPQPRQAAALACPVDDLFFGGARGGGKSDFLLADWIRHEAEHGENARGLILRRTMPQLTEIIDRSKQLYTRLGWTWFEKKSQWVSNSGAILHARYLDRDSDAENYHGWNLNWLGVDEAGNFPSPAPIDKLYATLRSAKGVRTVIRLTGNPGGAGHGWLKQRYIDPADPMRPFEVDGHERVFIPSRLQDNRILMENDPAYIDRLKMVGNDELVRAWLEGDWNVSLGQFFTEFNPDFHVVPEQELPGNWVRLCGLDWGYKTPFCVLWAAVSDGTLPKFPPGALIFYREWYGGYPGDRGLGFTSQEVAQGMLTREHERIDRRVADWNIFRHDDGPPIAEGFAEHGIFWSNADKTREAGWEQCRIRLKGEGYGTDDWKPLVFFMDCCKTLIRTIPNMVHDENKLEDMLKIPEDHAVDTFRYVCQARPWMRETRQKKVHHAMTLNGLIEHTERNRAKRQRIESY